MEFGEILDFIQMAECGDLAFFENSEGEIKHVGVMLNSHEIIHASESNGRVMIDSIDQEGIINKITSKRTHHLRVIKRLL
jgi:cell wall-associated NlpC family hydrolase